MLGDISGATNIYIITGRTDMRKSLDGLCAIVMDQMKPENITKIFYNNRNIYRKFPTELHIIQKYL